MRREASRPLRQPQKPKKVAEMAAVPLKLGSFLPIGRPPNPTYEVTKVEIGPRHGLNLKDPYEVHCPRLPLTK